MLGKEEITVEKKTGLVVKRIDKRVEIELPKTYSRARIPFRKNQIPRPQYIVAVAGRIAKNTIFDGFWIGYKAGHRNFCV